jgi:hypothetical protein
LALDRDHVRVHQQQFAAVRTERVVLAQNARRHEREHGAGLRPRDAASDEAWLSVLFAPV